VVPRIALIGDNAGSRKKKTSGTKVSYSDGGYFEEESWKMKGRWLSLLGTHLPRLIKYTTE
jgi:hypothetical protein